MIMWRKRRYPHSTSNDATWYLMLSDFFFGISIRIIKCTSTFANMFLLMTRIQSKHNGLEEFQHWKQLSKKKLNQLRMSSRKFKNKWLRTKRTKKICKLRWSGTKEKRNGKFSKWSKWLKISKRIARTILINFHPKFLNHETHDVWQLT